MKDETVFCDNCEECVPDDHIDDVDTGRAFCDEGCKASYEQSEAENAWESYLSRYYGGEIVTQEERYRTDLEAKRRM